MSKLELIELPFEKWKETRVTIHLIMQIIGKTRLKLTHRKNHWWYMTLYASTRGFSTYSIPIGDGIEAFEIELNVHKRAITFYKTTGEEKIISLENNPSIAEVYSTFMEILKGWGMEPQFIGKPLDMNIDQRFEEITSYHYYDWDYIEKFWSVMRWVTDVFQEFSGRFYGKTSPPQIFWHHLDIAVTRFSDRKLDPMPKEARILEKDSYSHEQISFGFWAGDDTVPMPMFYSYSYPAPDGIDNEPLKPDGASWIDSNGSPMATLAYDSIRGMENPRKALLDFLESAYQAGAKLAGWNRKELEVPSLDAL